MAQYVTQDIKAQLVHLIETYLGMSTSQLYAGMFVQMPLEFAIKSAESLLSEYVGSAKANSLIVEVCHTQAQRQ